MMMMIDRPNTTKMMSIRVILLLSFFFLESVGAEVASTTATTRNKLVHDSENENEMMNDEPSSVYTKEEVDSFMMAMMKPPSPMRNDLDETKSKRITMNGTDEDDNVDNTFWRSLQQESQYKCYSTLEDENPNRYCTFEDAPRPGTFLMLACPDSKGEDLTKCGCTIGVGSPAEAATADTCNDCVFCVDGTFAYDCRNVAEGTCIGRNCLGQCISSADPPTDLRLNLSGATRTTPKMTNPTSIVVLVVQGLVLFGIMMFAGSI